MQVCRRSEGAWQVDVGAQRRRALWDRGQLEGELEDRRERAEASTPEPGQVVSGGVLHDLAAGSRRRAVAEDDARTDDPVARMEIAETRWTERRTRDDAADGRARRRSRLDGP